MPEQRTPQQFIDSADLKYQWAQSLTRPIVDATQALLACVTGGGKILICGNGASGALAQYTAALLVGGLERPRPELPALALGTDAATLTAVARRGEYADAFAARASDNCARPASAPPPANGPAPRLRRRCPAGAWCRQFASD